MDQWLTGRAKERLSHVKRYMFGWASPLRDGDLVMHERKDGIWVRYEDMLREVEQLMRAADSATSGEPNGT